MELNDQQLAAINNPGDTLLLAGPGTGKTATLTAKAAKILKTSSEEPILLLTFSKKASFEMKERLTLNLKDSSEVAKNCFVGTVHSWCWWTLNQAKENKWTLIDEATKNSWISQIVKSLGYKKGEWNRWVGLYRNESIELIPAEKLHEVKTIISELESHFEKEQGIDFDGILLKFLELLERGELEQEISNIRYLLIDEVQDLNILQINIVRHVLKNDRVRLFAVGDYRQGIYGFRGAKPEIILDLSSRLNRNIDVLQLTKTYRMSSKVTEIVNHIFPNLGELQTYASKCGQTFHLFTPTDYTEADWIAKHAISLTHGQDFEPGTISKHIINQTMGLGDLAILVRTYQTADLIARSLDECSLPYSIVGRDSWPSFPQLVKLHENLKKLIELEINSITNLKEVDDVILKLCDSPSLSLVEFLAKYWSDHKENRNMEGWINRLMMMARNYDKNWKVSLPYFLSEWNLLEASDEQTAADRINIMSIHAAKGLEFEVVFVPGFDEGLLPYNLNGKETDIEEEKRLLYVAASRAKSLLYFTSAKQRNVYGEIIKFEKSRFSNLIENSVEKLIDESGEKYMHRVRIEKMKKAQGSLF